MWVESAHQRNPRADNSPADPGDGADLLWGWLAV
jgi:hypothetical protein